MRNEENIVGKLEKIGAVLFASALEK